MRLSSFNPNRRRPSPLTIALAYAHVIIIGIPFGLVINHIMTHGEARHRNCAPKLHSLGEPAPQEVGPRPGEQLIERVFERMTVELGDDLPAAGHLHIEDNALLGRGHDVGILGRIHIERNAPFVALQNAVDARMESRLARLRRSESRTAEAGLHVVDASL